MNNKQEARLEELIDAMRQLAHDIYDAHWKSLSDEVKEALWDKFEENIDKLRIAMYKEDEKVNDGFNS